jgi:hypothetical protein
MLLGGVLPLVAACSFRSDLGAMERLRARISREVGTEASVNVHTAHGATTVTIRLARLPERDSLRVQQQVEELTKAEFPKTDYVVVLPRP